jgi:hypothetical protein
MKNAHMPYSQKGLEDLATALGVSTPMLWVSPVTGQINVKSPESKPERTTALYDLEESE